MTINSDTMKIVFWVGLLMFSGVTGCQTFNQSAVQNSEGVVYYTQGQYDQALPYFQEAARLDPNNAEALYNLASTYQQQAIAQNQPGQLIQAENYYRACLDKKPSAETTVCCYRGIATSMTRRNQADQAVELLKGWQTRNPNSVEPKLELAYLYEAQGKNAEALQELQSAVALAPNDYRVYYKTGVIEQKLGKKSDALNQYLMAGRLQPSNREIANRIGQLQNDPSLKAAQNAQLATNATSAGAVVANTSSWQSKSDSAVSLTPPNFTEAEKQTAAVAPKAAQPSSLASNPPAASRIPTTSSVSNTAPPLGGGSTPLAGSSAASTAPQLPDGTGTTPVAVAAASSVPQRAQASPVSAPVAAPPVAASAQQNNISPVPPVTAGSQAQQSAQAANNTQATDTSGNAATSIRRSRIGIVGNGPPITRVGPSL
ncbi:MAG: tetratricopeptide repeat protein [Thermoguttaceae bacterium]|nr:tetratricopeptide repeat protein [Thermoguttaceae bacterium]